LNCHSTHFYFLLLHLTLPLFPQHQRRAVELVLPEVIVGLQSLWSWNPQPRPLRRVRRAAHQPPDTALPPYPEEIPTVREIASFVCRRNSACKFCRQMVVMYVHQNLLVRHEGCPDCRKEDLEMDDKCYFD
jgi:hypothetical protein